MRNRALQRESDIRSSQLEKVHTATKTCERKIPPPILINKKCHRHQGLLVFPVVMYACENWTRKKAERWRMDAFELWCWRRFLKSPLDCKEIQPVHPKGNKSWIFTGRTDAEAEAPILWPPDAKNWLIWKDPDAGKDWWQEEKETIEDEMVGWHYWLSGHEFE